MVLEFRFYCLNTFMHVLFKKKTIDFNVLERKSEEIKGRREKSMRDGSSICQFGLLAESKSQELQPALQAIFHCHPRCLSRKMDVKWSSQPLRWHLDVECRYPQLYHSAHSVLKLLREHLKQRWHDVQCCETSY